MLDELRGHYHSLLARLKAVEDFLDRSGPENWRELPEQPTEPTVAPLAHERVGLPPPPPAPPDAMASMKTTDLTPADYTAYEKSKADDRERENDGYTGSDDGA